MSKIAVLDKSLIARAFQKSQQSYEKHAIVQKEMGLALLDRLLTVAPTTDFARVLEIGCCTGEKTGTTTNFQNPKVLGYRLICKRSGCRFLPHDKRASSRTSWKYYRISG